MENITQNKQAKKREADLLINVQDIVLGEDCSMFTKLTVA